MRADTKDMMTTETPLSIDTKLAELHTRLSAAREIRNRAEATIYRLSGLPVHTFRGNRVPAQPIADALPIVLAKIGELEAEDTYDGQRWPIRDAVYGRTSGLNLRSAKAAFETFHNQTDVIDDLREAIRNEDDKYTGWSRFFLVTSSAGHIHSSMSCSTCRPTTAYGWMPELSGKSEEEAVSTLGPALCSVCFPSAPVDYVGGKITKAQAGKLAHS
jgi:hypothetical protein